ncbi:M14 family metallopeptidase [Ascidiimonas sp. W6]|uniref:M14 family metallopeptidase n=1 Tax=Ascidiimonas meishanensis TaxID=3128903 RepID=UPI0030EEC540
MRLFITSILISVSTLLTAQNLKSPSEFLGYELGTRFTRHHQVVDYYRHIAQAMPSMVKLESYGKTNEQRTLLVAFVSSPENIDTLEDIRTEHLKNTKGQGSPDKAIVWLGYNVHGNESVSTEASMQTIYDLLTKKQEWLKNTVVIIDPCINPDGRDRYVNWYNQYVNAPNNVDPNSKEHHEPWISGRSNHYMFDLNRDWAWVTQVESQQRLKVFNKWLPHVHVDFHEQGVDDPYYFAPAAEPFHEIITQWQRDFQVAIGKNHAKYFDKEGWFYFTKEVFDLLYPSYGDTYPTYNGGIGMTYEQGGSGRAGLGITTSYGDTLTLKDRIAHHYTTGISTVEISSKNAQKLNEEFKKFYTNRSFKYKSYVLNGDADKISMLTELLDQHEIKYGFASNSSVKGFNYKTGTSGSMRTSINDLVVSTNQPKGKLVKVLFEPNTKLSDSLTYDITAWSLPYAYGLNTIASESAVSATPKTVTKPEIVVLEDDAYAYLTNWSSMQDARFLAALLANNIRVRYAVKPFEMNGVSYSRGSLIITKLDNRNYKNFLKTLAQTAYEHGQTLASSKTGFVDSGYDFGSDNVKMIPKVKVALLSGGSTSTLNFGETWHYFEQQLGYPVSILDHTYFNKVDLSHYDVLILPELWGGSFFSKDQLEKVRNWVKQGGKLIAIGDALKALADTKEFGLKKKIVEKDSLPDLSSFGSGNREYIKNLITGAIFKAKVDITHPLAFGYNDTYFTLKLSDNSFEYLNKGNVVYLSGSDKPISGFAGSEARKKVANSLVFGVEKVGKGSVIYFVDNPIFRGFWENGKLFFANAVFMVNNR